MLKSLWLTILGWFRTQAEEKTDLRYAGKEQQARTNQSIASVRAQRNKLAGDLIGLKNERDNAQAKADEYAAAVKKWNAEGDQDREDRSYDAYVIEIDRVTAVDAEILALENDIITLDGQISGLSDAAREAATHLKRAANVQQVGRASAAVEKAHADLTDGPLAGAIESAKSQANTAQATREAREKAAGKDLLVKPSNAKSRADLLK